MEDYSYIYHWSPYRPKEKSWAYIHRDDEFYYWNGIGPDKDGEIYKKNLRIYYGSTPDVARKIKELSNEIHKTL